MFWILYRNRIVRETVLFETDDREAATLILRGSATSPVINLIDFCGELDGALDHALAGVTLSDPETAKAA